LFFQGQPQVNSSVFDSCISELAHYSKVRKTQTEHIHRLLNGFENIFLARWHFVFFKERTDFGKVA